MRNWFSNLGKVNQIVITVATTVITLVTLGGILWAGYGKLTDWFGPDIKKETPWLGLQVWQDEAPQDIQVVGEDEFQRNAEVAMARQPFQIRFPQQKADSDYISICAWTDDSIFKAKPGMDLADPGLPSTRSICLQEGGALATTRALGLKRLLLSEVFYSQYSDDVIATVGGQNRIYVQEVWKVPTSTLSFAPTTSSTKQLVPIEQLGQDLPSSPPEEQPPIPIEQLDQDIFLLVFIDKDADLRIDPDEYQNLALRFQ